MTEHIDTTTGEVTDVPEEPRFNAAHHLTSIKGQEYLEVKWRLVWFRDAFPAGRITTELVRLNETGDAAIFRAEIIAADEDGAVKGSAVGHGACTAQEFGNFIEKAETKAIGRALGALGFGTQFADDFAEGPDVRHIADAPVQRGSAPPRPQTPRQQDARQQFRASGQPMGGSGAEMSPAQKGKIEGMCRRLGIAGPEIDALCQRVTGAAFTALTKPQASRVIDTLIEQEKSRQ